MSATLPPSQGDKNHWALEIQMSVASKVDKAINVDGNKKPAVKSHDFAKFARLLRKYHDIHGVNNGGMGKTHDLVKSFLLTTTLENVMTVGNSSHVIFSDNLDRYSGVPLLKSESVALTFTSPPYWNFVDYAGSEGVGYEDSYKEYLNSLLKLFRTIAKKTMPGGRMVVNASNMKSRRSIEGESFVYPIVPDIIGLAKRAGFTFFDEIIWVKGGANAGALKGRVLFGSYPYPPTPQNLGLHI